MKLNDVLTVSEIQLNNIEKRIRIECSDFLSISGGRPIFKNVNNDYPDYCKIKLRQRKNHYNFTETFNKAFKIKKLSQKALFAQSKKITKEDNLDSFYVFPKNGFNFLFSTEVQNSTEHYKEIFESLISSSSEGISVFSDLMQYTYRDNNLEEGIKHGAEIIIYNIPYFYGIRSNIIEYDELFNKLY